MRSDKKLMEIAWEMLDRMYNEAEPALDFKKFREEILSGKKDCSPQWYLSHEISIEKYEEIIKDIKKARRVTGTEWRKITWVILDYSPKFKEGKRNEAKSS